MPAADIGKGMSLRESWRQTRDIKGQIFLLAGFETVLYIGIFAAVSWVSALIGAVVLAVILGLLQIWILTLYGYLIEKRPLQGATHS